MKLNTKKFKDALNNTLQFVDVKSSIPSTTYLIFKLNRDTLTISAQALDGLTLSYLKVDNKDNDTFEFMLSEVTELNKIIGTISANEFDFSKNERLLTVKARKKEFKLGTIEYEAQTYKKHNITSKFENVDFEELKNTLTIVNKFSANDELRPIMNGVNINKDHIIATNSHFLYKMPNTILPFIIDGDDTLTPEFILDKAFINKLSKVKLKGFVNVIITEKTFTIQSIDFVTTSRLIEGNYPNYRAILPQHNNSITVDKLDLVNSLKDAMITSSQTSLMCKLETKDNFLTLSSRDIDFAKEYSNSLELTDNKYKDQEMLLGIKISFLLELLSVIDTEEISIEYGSKGQAMIIHGVEKGESSNQEELGLLMPMML